LTGRRREESHPRGRRIRELELEIARTQRAAREEFRMKATEGKAAMTTEAATADARLGAGSWTILIVLFALLAATAVVVYLGWTLGKDAEVPTSGYVAMALGVVVSLAVGFGLMALIFYSSRKGYDEPPVLISGRDDGDVSGSGETKP
jgi:hypothetical protein